MWISILPFMINNYYDNKRKHDITVRLEVDVLTSFIANNFFEESQLMNRVALIKSLKYEVLCNTERRYRVPDLYYVSHG